MFQRGSLTLFRVRGVPIRAHWSLLLIVPYLAYVLAAELHSPAWGVVLALGLFASITLHELAHTFVALRFGGQVRGITLMILGGVSQMSRMPRRPLHEAVMAGVGPLTSLVIGVVLYLCARGAHAASPDVQMALYYLGVTNLVLGVFNLVPAFPMDGGRLLRALLAARLSRIRATQIAARVGMVCAICLGALGAATGNFLLVLVAVFVFFGARGELGAERVRDALAGLRVVDLLPGPRNPPPLVAASETLANVLPRMRQLDRLELVVVDRDGAARAVIRAGDLRDVASGARWATTVGELAARLPVRHVLVPWDAGAIDAIDRVTEAGREYVVVTEPRQGAPDEVVGLLAADVIARQVQLALAGGRRPPDEPN
ncbi:MAG TPA: site-2 protease family protein [Kofleriaceae bacterium]|nr:site-2 protease family protein [Kofleriaceae bacterium]